MLRPHEARLKTHLTFLNSSEHSQLRGKSALKQQKQQKVATHGAGLLTSGLPTG